MIDKNSPMANLVMVFSRPGCPPCNATKRKLAKLGIEYVEIDLATNEEAVPVLKAAGATEAPVVTYGGSIWTTGYNPDRIDKLAEVILHPWPEEAADMSSLNGLRFPALEDLPDNSIRWTTNEEAAA